MVIVREGLVITPILHCGKNEISTSLEFGVLQAWDHLWRSANLDYIGSKAKRISRSLDLCIAVSLDGVDQPPRK